MSILSGLQVVSYVNKQNKQVDGYRVYFNDDFNQRDVNLGSVGISTDIAWFDKRSLAPEFIQFLRDNINEGLEVIVTYNKYGRPASLSCPLYDPKF